MMPFGRYFYYYLPLIGRFINISVYRLSND